MSCFQTPECGYKRAMSKKTVEHHSIPYVHVRVADDADAPSELIAPRGRLDLGRFSVAQAQRCALWQPMASPLPRSCAMIFSKPWSAPLLASTEGEGVASSHGEA
jgi:hypothetical protein